MSGANASRVRDFDDLRAIVLSKGECERLKDAMRRAPHTELETARRLGLVEPPLHRPGGRAASYVTDWDGGIGVYPKMVWERVEADGYDHLLPTHLREYRRKFNGDPKRPFGASELRITLRMIGLDYQDFLGLGPATPAHLDTLIAEARSLCELPLAPGPAADRVRTELDRQMRMLAELLVREKAELLRDPRVGVLGVIAVRQALEKARLAHARATEIATTATAAPQTLQ